MEEVSNILTWGVGNISKPAKKSKGGGGGESREGGEAVCYVREREILLEYSRMITLLLDAGQKISEKKMGG